MDPEARYLTARQVAERLGTSTRTLKRWRQAGHGPAWSRLPHSRLIRYPLRELETWERQGRQEPASTTTSPHEEP